MATCGGIEYEDFTNIKKNGRISSLGNDASENMQVKMSAGSWSMLKKVDFGAKGAEKIMLRAKGDGTVEFRFGRKGAKASVTFNIASSDMTDYVVDVDPAIFTGQKTIYIVATAGTGVYLDAWQATEAGTASIDATLRNSEKANSDVYDLSGRKVSRYPSAAVQQRGIVIEQYTDENGVRHSRKRF